MVKINMQKTYNKLLDIYSSTLRVTSQDDSNGICMTESELKVVNFDKVKRRYSSELCLSHHPKSCDALFVNKKGEMYFIEFKNGRIDENETTKIKFKLYDSLLIFLDKSSITLNNLRKKSTFILVYNYHKKHSKDALDDCGSDKTSFYTIANTVTAKGGGHIIRFGLYLYKKLYFKEVYTCTQEEFNKLLDDLICC